MGQDLVEGYVIRVSALSLEFELQMAAVVLEVNSLVGSSLRRSLDVNDGVVVQSPENAAEIRLIDETFKRALAISGYYSLVVAFVSGFASQVDEFETLYAESRSAVGELPTMYLTEIDREILSSQASAALVAMESSSLDVVADLRQLSSRFLGEVRLEELLAIVSDTIRKMSKVELIARDQLLLFFRLVGDLVYKNVESSFGLLLYEYAGPRDDRNRRFCERILDSGKSYARAEIDAMDNGRVPGVFDNCGGHGCRHWWGVVKVA